VETRSGFTLIELLIVATIMGALAALAIPNFQRAAERARRVKAIGDITVIQQACQEYFLTNSIYPTSLAQVDWGGFVDPWGNPYRYLRVQGASPGQLRKDRFLVPINSDFDLYSSGPDGRSVAPLTAAASRDDIVRANDGGFVGVAQDF
jgi:general secretion pathway protein G